MSSCKEKKTTFSEKSKPSAVVDDDLLVEVKAEKVATTPLPRLKMAAVAAVLFSESVCTTMLLPFVGLYVSHLQNISVEDAGYSSGILVGLFMLGQFISTKLWGWLSDVYGRRAPLTIGLFAGAWTMLFFGMAPNIYVCCLLRFLHGFFNGNVLIAKVIIADITDKTNSAAGYAMSGLMWSSGSVIGPAVGGFLYDPLANPKLQWMNVKEGSFLGRNPAFLPSLFVCVYTLFSFVVCIVVLPETNPNRTRTVRDFPVIGWIMNIIRPRAVQVAVIDVPERDELDNVEEQEEEEKAQKSKGLSYLQAYRDPVIFSVSVLYMCMAATDIAFLEVFPLYCVAPVSTGGLSMFSDTVGVLLILSTFPAIVGNLCFTKIYNAFETRGKMWCFSMSMHTLAIVMMPFASYVPQSCLYAYVLIVGGFRFFMETITFNLSNLLMARSAPPGMVGSVYGITQSMGVIVRCVVPILVSPIFAWSLTNGYTFPFNQCFVFLLTIIPTVYSLYIAVKMQIERTAEEISEWVEQDEVDGIGMMGTELDSAADYRSLANSFASGPTENFFVHINDIQATRREMMTEWEKRTAPRGVNKDLDYSVKALQMEDWRVHIEDEFDEDDTRR